MYLRRKVRNRIIFVIIVLLGIIVWRGLKATTEGKFACEYKLVYAVCKPLQGQTELPGMLDILKAGVKF